MTNMFCRLACALLCMASHAAHAGDAGIELFSPEGEVKAVRQVTVRFSESMVPFGDPRQLDPFDIDCVENGSGRWADDRNWVYDFDRDLPAGVRCGFTIRRGLASLAGQPIASGRRHEFTPAAPPSATACRGAANNGSTSTRCSSSVSTRRPRPTACVGTPTARPRASPNGFRFVFSRARSAARCWRTARASSPAGIRPFSSVADARYPAIHCVRRGEQGQRRGQVPPTARRREVAADGPGL